MRGENAPPPPAATPCEQWCTRRASSTPVDASMPIVCRTEGRLSQGRGGRRGREEQLLTSASVLSWLPAAHARRLCCAELQAAAVATAAQGPAMAHLNAGRPSLSLIGCCNSLPAPGSPVLLQARLH